MKLINQNQYQCGFIQNTHILALIRNIDCDSIYHTFQAFDSSDEVMKKATAEDLIRCAKPITAATAKAVAAGNSCRQEDIISAANMGRKAIFDLLSVVKVIIVKF